jgi:hypothetical protein
MKTKSFKKTTIPNPIRTLKNTYKCQKKSAKFWFKISFTILGIGKLQINIYSK